MALAAAVLSMCVLGACIHVRVYGPGSHVRVEPTGLANVTKVLAIPSTAIVDLRTSDSSFTSVWPYKAYRFSADSGQQLTFELKGRKELVHVDLYNSAAERIGGALIDARRPKPISFTAPANGTYYLVTTTLWRNARFELKAYYVGPVVPSAGLLPPGDSARANGASSSCSAVNPGRCQATGPGEKAGWRPPGGCPL